MKKYNIDPCLIPGHIAFIMDGNGRWAKKRGLPRSAGHKAGARAFEKIARHCGKLGVKYATFYAFSTENWKRPKEEIENIMQLFEEYLDKTLERLDEDTSLRFIGDRSILSEALQNKMNNAEAQTSHRTGICVLIAVNYGGRQEIVNAACAAAQLKARDPSITITDKLLSENLYTAGIPDPDLIIRPSGEQRISNFLLWQGAYSELWYHNVLWPDFDEKTLEKAICDYLKRSRRFGGI